MLHYFPPLTEEHIHPPALSEHSFCRKLSLSHRSFHILCLRFCVITSSACFRNRLIIISCYNFCILLFSLPLSCSQNEMPPPPRPLLSGGGEGGGEGKVEKEERWGAAFLRTPELREHSARTHDTWRTRVQESESLHCCREPGPGSSVWNRGGAERDDSSDSLTPSSDRLLLGWSSFHPTDTLREDFCRHERGPERHLSLIRATSSSPVAPV